MTTKNYVMGEHIYLEKGKCIQVIEKELSSFFKIRLKSVHLVSELYIKGSLRSLGDILNFLCISNDEIKNLIETVVYKISSKIIYILRAEAIYFNIDSKNKNYKQYIENSINEFTRTEKVLGLYEKFLDKSLRKIFETYCESRIFNHVFHKSSSPKKILSSYTIKKQKHGDSISKQLKVFILNLECELRNELIKSTSLLINSLYTYDENSTVA